MKAIDLAARLGRDKPTDQQIQIIEAPHEAAVVIAGAGSGKTTTMTDRVLWLVVNQIVEPELILGLTFTHKAANDLATKIRTGIQQLRSHGLIKSDGLPTISTYHAYGARFLNDHALRAGYEPPSRTLRDASIWQMAYSVVSGYRGDMSGIDADITTIVKAVISLSDQMSEHNVTPAQVAEFQSEMSQIIDAIPAEDRFGVRAPVRDVLARQQLRVRLLPMVQELLERRQGSGEYSFGDQMTLAARVAAERPEVAQFERAKFASVLLDEYQDTSQSQLTLMRSLFAGYPVMAVGDPLQAIYGWRGASTGTIENFATTFLRPGGEPAHQFALTTSWRNDKAILSVANTFVDSLHDQGLPGHQLQARSTAGPGRVSLGLYETELAQAEAIGDWLLPYWERSQNPTPDDKKPITISVLVRKKKEMEAIERALLARGMRVEVVGVAGLLQTPEVADLHAYLRVIFDPSAGDALMRILTGPRWRIGPADIAALYRTARKIESVDSDLIERSTLIEALDELESKSARSFTPDGRERLLRLARELRALRTKATTHLTDLITDIERTIGLDIEIGALPIERSQQARRHVDRFIAEAAEFAAAGGGPIAFLSWLDAAEERERGLTVGAADVVNDAVQLLTIHTSKGLEWDVVVVPGMSHENFPSKDRGDDNWLTHYGTLPFPLRGDYTFLPTFPVAQASNQKRVDQMREEFKVACADHGALEEERLAYVAVTRPKLALLVTATWWRDGKKSTGASPFFDRIRTLVGAGVELIHDHPAPEDDATNPMHEIEIRSTWPVDPLAASRGQFDAAIALVDAKPSLDHLTEVGQAWLEDARLLLAEKPDQHVVYLPPRLSVSALVGLHSDPEELAKRLRRPMPFKPDPLARRGTAFHKWLEERFGPALLDLDDEVENEVSETQLEVLKQAWLASDWADKKPYEVEVPFETTVDGILIRGRMDAVYRDDAGWHIVDWKTGGPKSGDELAATAVQLAVYRLAWSQLMKIPLEHIRASFHHVAVNKTVSPADLLDYQGLVDLLRGSDDQR